MTVFVLGKDKRALMPCSEKRACLLLARGRARVHRMAPFTIRLVDRTADDCALQPLRLKLDPGSKITGLALVREIEVVAPDTGEITRCAAVISLFELVHRGRQISEALTARRQMRRRRRANLRYRAPRFDNRTRPAGWLAPSLQHRVDTTTAWVSRIGRWAPVTAFSSELVRFDMQQMQNPEIEGAEYQQGTLAGYEVREYLLEKWKRACAYCDAKNIPLQIEHIEPRSKGGSHRISNLCIACGPCNQKKAARTLQDFLKKDPARLARIQMQAKRPLRDAAAVNATRWALAKALRATGLTLELASGGRTKFNRCTLGVPKTHALDAACVGQVDALTGWQKHTKHTVTIKAMGRGCYQRTRLDAFGFPRGYLMRKKSVHGFQTGDMVKAVVAKGKKAGTHVGRVAIRKTGSFNITTPGGVVQGIGHKNCRIIQRNDGYGYVFNRANNAGREQVMVTAQNASAALQPALYLSGLNPGVSRAFR